MSKRIFFIFIVICFVACSVSEKPLATWDEYIVSFYPDDPEAEVIGYVNEHGDTVLDAVFNPVFSNRIIRQVGAMNSLDSTIGRFYLNKKGKVFGRDSLWAFDFSYDVESEGFIRFSVGRYEDQTKRVGLYDWEGNVRIPANYNWLSIVRNGVLMGFEGGEYHLDGEYWFTKNDTAVLLDTNGNVLVDDPIEMKKIDRYIDFHSKRIVDQEESGRVNIKMKDGRYLSFLNIRDELIAYLQQANFDDFLLDSLLLNDNGISKSDFVNNPQRQSYRNKVLTLQNRTEALNMQFGDLPTVYCEGKVVYQGKEVLTGTWLVYDFLKPFEEYFASDAQYGSIPIIEVFFDWNDYYLTFARPAAGTYKLLAISVRE